MMFDSGVSVQFWYYVVVHEVLIYSMLTMTRNKNDQEQDKTVWEVHHFGVRDLSGIYLGCVFNTKSGVYDFLMTDDRSVFSTPNQMRCFGDIFQCKFTKVPLIPHRPEDLQEVDSDDEEESFLVHETQGRRSYVRKEYEATN